MDCLGTGRFNIFEPNAFVVFDEFVVWLLDMEEKERHWQFLSSERTSCHLGRSAHFSETWYGRAPFGKPCGLNRLERVIQDGFLVMPIYRLFNSSGLQSDRVTVIAAVFDDLCQALGLSPIEDSLRDIVAEAVIECAQKGVTDPDEVRKCAEAALSKASSPQE
jgi:hypothetical protein